MSLKKGPTWSVNISCNHVITMLLAMTSLCFAQQSLATEESYLKIPAFGRRSNLGYLYDERTDTFRDISVFSKDISKEFITQTQITEVVTETGPSNTFQEKLQFFEIDLNAAVNILAGSTTLRGSARILKENKRSLLEQQQTLLMTHHTVKENLQVFYNGLLDTLNLNFLHHREATHIVTSISWGARVSLTLETKYLPEVDAQDMSAAFSEEFQKITQNSSSKYNEGRNPNITIRIQSDFQHEITGPGATTVEEATNILNAFPKLLSESKDKIGVPLEFTLTPIREIREYLKVSPIFNIVVHKINEIILTTIFALFSEISITEQRINELHDQTLMMRNCLDEKIRDDIAYMLTSFLEYKMGLVANLRETLIDVRSGDKPSLAVTEMVENHGQSNFSSKVLISQILNYSQILKQISFCNLLKMSYGEIEYFGSRQNLIPTISEHSDKPIYVLVTQNEFKLKDPFSYTENLNIFLKTLYTPSNKLFFVDCDVSHYYCYNLTKTEIHEYKSGRLATTDFKKQLEENQLRILTACWKDGIPCSNRGECNTSNETGLPSCNCSAGYEGKYCNINTNDCTASACSNGGTCIDGIESFSCNCAAGFTGITCDINIDDCSGASSCLNGATCIDSINSFTCDCAPGYEGNVCEIVTDNCGGSNKCFNGGSCINHVANFTCFCSPGFSGNTCEINTDDCNNGKDSCSNGGTCVDGVNTYSCICREGYTGTTCQSNIDDCAGNTMCQNGGNCIDGVNAYSCICAIGFTGAHCEVNTDDCAGRSKCQNGGTCVDLVNGYRCNCIPGYSGGACEFSTRNANIRLFTLRFHKGNDKSWGLSNNRCVYITPYFSPAEGIQSLDTGGTCVKVCDTSDCRGTCHTMRPGTLGHWNLEEINFLNRIRSVQAC